MLNKITDFAIKVLSTAVTGGISVIASLWGKRIRDGKKTFEDVPAGLKEQVKAWLIAEGLEHLITE